MPPGFFPGGFLFTIICKKFSAARQPFSLNIRPVYIAARLFPGNSLMVGFSAFFNNLNPAL